MIALQKFQSDKPILPDNFLYINDWVKIIYNDPIFAEAFFWSSPSLHSAFKKLKSGTLRAEHKDKVIVSLYKYFVRVSSSFSTATT